MKNKMGFVHKFAYSFFNFEAYKEFFVQGLGNAIFYIFLVTVIFTTISNINTLNEFDLETSNLQSKLIHNSPNFELKNGLFSIDSNEPIYYKHNDEQLIVDTSGKTNELVLDSYKNGVYINSDELVIRQNYSTFQTLKFSDYADLYLTNEMFEDALATLKILFPAIFLLVSPIASFLMNLVSGFLILGPLSLSISSMMGVKLSYSKACTLSFYALTLPLLLEALLNISGLNLSEFPLVFYGVGLVYCGLAIKEIKNINKSNLNYM